jgi:hypothetical protein
MWQEILKTLFAFVLLTFPLANCASAQNADLSTDAGVIAELQKRVDAKNAEGANGDEKLIAKQKAASKLEAKDVCIERLKESAKIIVIGFFRTDVGCRFDGAFVDSRYYERENSDISKIALGALGWEKANRTQRENLAKIWVEKALLVFAPLPSQKVSAISFGDSEIKVTASSEYPPNVTSRSVTKQFVFDKDGNLLSAAGY